MSTDNHVNESILNSDIKEWQKKNRIDHMAYLPGMEVLESEVQAQVIESMNAYDYTGYTEPIDEIWNEKFKEFYHIPENMTVRFE